MVHYSNGGLNSGLLVCYSNHGLNKGHYRTSEYQTWTCSLFKWFRYTKRYSDPQCTTLGTNKIKHWKLQKGPGNILYPGY